MTFGNKQMKELLNYVYLTRHTATVFIRENASLIVTGSIGVIKWPTLILKKNPV